MKNITTNKLRFAVLAVDVVIFSIIKSKLNVRLIEARAQGYVGKRALPGGLIDPKEEAEEAARRHMYEKAGVSKAYIEQLYTFSKVDRDRRGRVVSVAYLGLISEKDAKNAKDTSWSPVWNTVDSLRGLAYDHTEILKVGIERLKSKISYSNLAHALLPKEFTLSDLQKVYEIILGEKIDKRNFRRKMLSLGLVKSVDKKIVGGPHRPAQLYKFTTTKFRII